MCVCVCGDRNTSHILYCHLYGASRHIDIDRADSMQLMSCYFFPIRSVETSF